jgi:tartrate-resistant acid phosphatase type 5
LIMMDTSTYTGSSGQGQGYFPDVPVDAVQQAWLEDALRSSTADYIVVGSHYPVYSVCQHGNIATMVQAVKPLLEQYHAHIISGHDHCVSHVEEAGVSYWVNGIGHGCW